MIDILFCTDRLHWTTPHLRPTWPRSGRCLGWTDIPLTRAPCWKEKPSPGHHTAPRRFQASLWLFRSSSGLSWCVISPGRPSSQSSWPSRRIEILSIRLFWENKYFRNFSICLVYRYLEVDSSELSNNRLRTALAVWQSAKLGQPLPSVRPHLWASCQSAK